MPAAVESLMYARAVPWHKLGTKVDGLQVAADALSASGLDWTVRKTPLLTSWNGEHVQVPNTWANVRTSDGAVLGVVGDQYQILQNEAAFDWADNLIDSGAAKYETAGSLMGGRRVFLSMELPEGVHIPGDDGEVKPYILVTNSHDGSSPIIGAVTPVRVVCCNTLNLALREAHRTFRIRHTGSLEGKLAAAREALGITFDYMSTFQAVATRMVQTPLAVRQAEKILAAAFPLPKRAQDDPDKVADTTFGQVLDNWRESDTIANVRNTSWGLLNAVGEFLDHEEVYHGRRFSAEDVKADSLLYGGPAQTKKQAVLDLLLKIPVGVRVR